MNGTSEERLYNLLPALYRRRDEAEGEPLRALMSVLETQFKELERDIREGYDNWFVETCDAWVLPYLADLVGMSNLREEKQHTFSTQRRQVANTIAYRCRKGTIATLEHVLRDATGWLACAVEFDRRLAVNHHLARLPGEQGRTVDVRRTDALAELGGPFDELAHTAEVCAEPPASADAETLRSGQYSAGRLGLFFWRLRSFRMTNSRPRSHAMTEDPPHSMAIHRLLNFLNRAKSADEIVQRIADDPEFGSARGYGVRLSLARRILKERDRLPNRRFESLEQVDDVRGVGPDTLHDMLASFSGLYTFHPLGVDMPLFNWPQYIAEIDQRAASLHMPLALSRLQLAADLAEYEAQYGRWPEKIRPYNSRFYGPDRGLNVAIWSPDSRKLEPTSIPPSRVLSMDLSRWSPALGDRILQNPECKHKQVAIDVQLGRLAFLRNPLTLANATQDPGAAEDIRVTYCYGFSTSMGGGPYHRDLRRLFSVRAPFHIDVAKGAAGNGTATQAEGQTVPPDCVPTLSQALKEWHEHQDKSRRPRGVIRILDNGLYDEKLEIKLDKGSHLTIIADNGARPVVGNNAPLTVVCEGEGSEERRQLRLSGLLVHGGLRIGTPEQAGATGGLTVTIEHCTLVTSEDRRLKPAGIEAKLTADCARGLELSIAHSIVGPLRLPANVAAFRVQDSIIDHSGGDAIAASAAEDQPDLPPDQVTGPPATLKRTTVFGKVAVQELQSASEVIFTEPVFVQDCKCGSVSFSHVPTGSQTPAREFCQPPDDASAAQVRPRFTSIRFGDPGYAQLSPDCPRAIRGGAADGSEMGAFHDLYQLQAEENLREVLEEYLPLGLQASVQYAT